MDTTDATDTPTNEEPTAVGAPTPPPDDAQLTPQNTTPSADENTPSADDLGNRHGVTTALLAVLVAIFGAAALKATSGIIIPLILAIFLCYLLSPIMSWLAEHRVPEGLTIPCAMLVLVIALIPLNAVIVSTIFELQNRVPFYAMRFEDIAGSLLDSLGTDANVLNEVNWVEDISGALTSITVTMFGSVIGFVGNLVLVVTYTAFILIGRKGFQANIERAFSQDRASELKAIFAKMNQQIQRYIATKIMLSLGTGFAMFLVLLLFGVDFALFWGLLGFLLNFIPTVGSLIAVLLPIGVALLQFSQPIDVVWVAISLVAIQQVIGNVIEPALQGKRLNMSPIVVLFALVFFGWLWGFWGMVLSVPLMAVLKIVFEHTPALKPIAILLEKG